jgi:hypothetical protein
MDRRPSLFLVEQGHAVPFLRQGDATVLGHSPGIKPVQTASGIQARQVEKIDFYLVPLARAI